MPLYCPSCAEPVCSPIGKSKELLILGDAPSQLDIQGGPYATHAMYVTGGKIMRKELEKLGVSLNQFRVTYIWLHEPTTSESCWQAGYDHALEEAKGKKAILLVGSDTLKTFTKYNVSDVNGLEVDSHVLSAPTIYAMINPGLALHRSYGEIRFALTQFVQRLDQEGLL